VLSESVANGLRSTGGDEVVETIKFVDYFDKFFDCVNVSSLLANVSGNHLSSHIILRMIFDLR